MSGAAESVRRGLGPLAVVVPMANEAATVEAFLTAVTQELGADDVVLCVLDGASRDTTRELVEAMGQHDARIRVIWAETSRCVVDAYFAGYRAALATSAGWILEMDAGFSHEPAAIPTFLEKATEGYDYIGGSRFLPGGVHEGPWKRTLISWAGSTLARWVLRRPMTDFTSGFQLYRRTLLEVVVAQGVMSRAHFFQTEIRYLATAWRWTEVPIRYGRTTSEVPQGSVTEALRNLWKLARGGAPKRPEA